MKLAIAAFSTALVLATSASAMIGGAHSQFSTSGDAIDVQINDQVASPAADYGVKTVTVFVGEKAPQTGADAR